MPSDGKPHDQYGEKSDQCCVNCAKSGSRDPVTVEASYCLKS